jgi:hypothetical protein
VGRDIGAEPGILDGGPERLSDAQDRIAVPLHHTPEADALSLPAADMGQEAAGQSDWRLALLGFALVIPAAVERAGFES